MSRPTNIEQKIAETDREAAAPGSLKDSNVVLLVRAIEQAGEAILITDTASRIQYVNPAFTRMTGYTGQDVIGRKTNVLKSNRQKPEYYRDLWKTILAGEVWHGELINRRKDGTQYTEEMTITPVRDSEGAITNFIAIKQDVTSRRADLEALHQREREVRKHLAEIEQIYKYAPVGLVYLDREYRILRINEHLAAVTGMSAAQALGKTVQEIVPELAGQLGEAYRQIYERGEPILDLEIHGAQSRTAGERYLLCSFIPHQVRVGRSGWHHRIGSRHHGSQTNGRSFEDIRGELSPPVRTQHGWRLPVFGGWNNP